MALSRLGQNGDKNMSSLLNWEGMKLEEDHALFRDQQRQDEQVLMSLEEKLGAFNVKPEFEIFEIAKKLAKSGFQIRVEFPQNVIFVVGKLESVKNVVKDIVAEQFSEEVVKIQL